MERTQGTISGKTARRRTPSNGNSADEGAIRAGVETWTKAVSARDADSALRLYAQDVRSFELAPPLQMLGVEEVGTALREWLSRWRELRFETKDLDVHASGDAAYASFFNHLTGLAADGTRMDLWVRVTLGLRKEDDRWLVAHEHVSVPFHMDGSMRAALDLKP